MKTQLQQKPEIRKIRQVLDQYPNIKTVIIFGSLAAGNARQSSDLDIAVAAEKPLTAERKYRLISELALKTGRPVDLVDLLVAGEPLLGQILKTGELLKGTSDHVGALLSKHIIALADFEPYRRRILSERRDQWIGN